MAFIGQNWVLAVTFVDSGANETTRRYELAVTDDAGDLTDVIAAVASIMAVLVADSDAHISKQTLSKTSVEDSFTLPTGAVNVEENAQISAKIFGTPNKSTVLEMPAPKIGMFVDTVGPNRNIVDLTASGLADDLLQLYVDGGVLFTSDGESVSTVGAKGKRVHHKSTKG
jgi:hypothetical protein